MWKVGVGRRLVGPSSGTYWDVVHGQSTHDRSIIVCVFAGRFLGTSKERATQKSLLVYTSSNCLALRGVHC